MGDVRDRREIRSHRDWIPACAGMTSRKDGGSGAYPASPAATFTLIAMMNTLKKNAITLCSKATRRR